MIFIQDIKERKVYWFLFPIVGLCAGVLFYQNTFPQLFYRTLFLNVLFIFLLIAIVFFYSKFKLKTKLSNTFGLGDGLLFLALTFSFSSISFIFLFVFGLIFSLTLHLLLKKNSKHQTVPLAGHLSLFFAIAYFFNWIGFLEYVYIF